MCLLYSKLLVQLSKRSRIETKKHILLLKIRKVVKTSCRTKTKSKKREKLYKSKR